MKIKLTLIFILLSTIAFSQYIANPSFEGEVGRTIVPTDWSTCHPMSSPDTEPCESELGTLASDGNTFITLVARGNSGTVANTCEDIQTDLLQPLLKDVCYTFSVDLKNSRTFGVYAGMAVGWVSIIDPVILRFFGGNTRCEETELFFETEAVTNTEWETYTFTITPTISDIDYLKLAVDWVSLPTYMGNVQVDNIRLTAVGDNNVQKDLTVSCGDFLELQASDGISYEWSPSEGLSCSDCQNPIVEALYSMTYTAKFIKDNCAFSEQFNIIVDPFVSEKDTLMLDTTLMCEKIIELQASEGDFYDWNPKTGLSCSNCQFPTADLPNSLEYMAIISNGFCKHKEYFKIELDANISETNVEMLDTTIIYGFFLNLEVSEGEYYSWSPSIGLSCTDCQTPIANVPYSLTYTATITKGLCEFTEFFKINVTPFIPNIITPNGDGKNDIFYVDALEPNSKLTIMNRHGVVLFTTENYENDWNGKINNTLLPSDTYWYSLKFPLGNSEEIGFIHIMYQ